MSIDAIVALTTVPDTATAQRLAQGLVEARLAACVNILPGVTSIYAWQGAIQNEPELQLVIKTRKALWPELERFMRERHPYAVPELLALEVVAGAATYLDWLGENTHVD